MTIGARRDLGKKKSFSLLPIYQVNNTLSFSWCLKTELHFYIILDLSLYLACTVTHCRCYIIRTQHRLLMSHHRCEVFMKLQLYFSCLVKSLNTGLVELRGTCGGTCDIENKRLQKDISPTINCTVRCFGVSLTRTCVVCVRD